MQRTALTAVMILCGLGLAVDQRVSVRAGDTAPILWRADQVNWSEIAELPGTRQAILWSDPGTGSYAAMNSWNATVRGPVHARRHNIQFVVLAGTFVLGVEGSPVTEIVPGSFAMVPGGVRYCIISGNQGETLFLSQQPGPPEVVGSESERK